MDALPRLMLVTDRRRSVGHDLVPEVAEAVRGGVGLVQVREKDLSDAELDRLVRRLLEDCGDARLIVNEHPRVARSAKVGLHLPADAPAESHEGLSLLGRSVHGVGQALRARDEGVDYLVLGTIYHTPSKPGQEGAGPGLVREVAAAVAPLPVFAIGGVDAERVPELIEAGAYGVAVCGAILSQPDSLDSAREIASALETPLATPAG